MSVTLNVTKSGLKLDDFYETIYMIHNWFSDILKLVLVKYFCWNLNELASKIKYIQNSNEQFMKMIDFEEWLECPECVKNVNSCKDD